MLTYINKRNTQALSMARGTAASIRPRKLAIIEYCPAKQQSPARQRTKDLKVRKNKPREPSASCRDIPSKLNDSSNYSPRSATLFERNVNCKNLTWLPFRRALALHTHKHTQTHTTFSAFLTRYSRIRCSALLTQHPEIVRLATDPWILKSEQNSYRIQILCLIWAKFTSN